MEKKVWFITGISSGLGKCIAEEVMEQGGIVAGTFRDRAQAEEFTKANQGKGYGIVLDITRPEETDKAVAECMARFGKIDVLVNNAGFGFAGAIEETSLQEVHDVFNANFFGALYLTQKFLPFFRKQMEGRIVQVSSHGGFRAIPGFGMYNASKFALEGFSEALAGEVAPFNVKVTIVEPGPFRTGFAGKGFREAAAVIHQYDGTAGVFRERMKAIHGRQEGDPYKAAKAIFDVISSDDPPLRLPLGKIAVASLNAKLESVSRDLEKYKGVAESVVYG
ncbi:short-chain dehydrogenase/reductase [Flavobacterium cyanobacteriorum]|uniref:Short-chain dehydrogenase/reductase n=1 Tax=Flavobacterium cyanobacteriorum TaxID=2022802 RepID=A0A255ZQ56_9FLAO|nr:oxidoreductase [Flavobacterium cyanobacteriorum]OYQ43551.1 short-chain dehydrogenase/reductase [Flavobacterium cyanobacteriorum]